MMTVGMPPASNVPRSLIRYAPPVSLEPRPEDFDLFAGLRLIRRRMVMIATLTLLLTAAAFPFVLGMKPVYHAESRLMIHRSLASGLAQDGLGRGDALDLASEIERLLSKGSAERVIRDLKLDESAEFNPALRGTSLAGRLRDMLRGLLGNRTSAPADPDGMERIIPEYYRALSVGRDGATAVIRIGFESRDPELAAAVPNKLIGIYLKERENSLRLRLASALSWIDQRVGEQRRRVASAREAMERYGKATGIASEGPDEQGKAVMDLSARQASIVQNRAQVDATISALLAAGDQPEALANVVVPDNIGTIERDLRRQQHDLERLLKTYGDNAEEVVAQRARIARTQSDLGIERERYIQSQRATLAALDLREAAVRADLMSARRKLSGYTLAQAELTRQQHGLDREQAALDKLEEQRWTLAAEAALPGVEAEILSPAAVPLLPQGHGRAFYLIVALLASVCIAATAAFVREMMDKSVRSYDQLEAIPGIIPAGFVPPLSRGRSLPVFFGHSQGGLFDEAMRSAVIALKQSNGGRFPASVIVTSAHGGEGKSLFARSLAIELAAEGQRVLLIDGDLRRGNIGSLFEPGLRLGLNDFLIGEAALADIVRHHSTTGIDFIPRGNPSLDKRPNLAGVAAVLEFARANGQVAIFDSAPILASTDTVQLTALVERTVLVVRWAKVSRQAVEYALRRVKSISNDDVVVTINKVNLKRHSLYGFRDGEMISKDLMEYQKKNYG